MPGKSHRGALPKLSGQEKALADELRGYVEKLAGDIGVRSTSNYRNLLAAQQFIHETLAGFGHRVRVQEYLAGGRTCANLEVEIPGTDKSGEILVVGAHYDTAGDSPGADDNASAVAGLLALARLYQGKRQSRTLRLVAFVNEEPPYFQTVQMGSYFYARSCSERGDRIVGMLALEMLGYYSDEKKSQRYPPPLGWLYPSTGNFIAFVGNFGSRSLVRRSIKSFRQHARFPSEGAALPSALPGIGYSDHWSFWQIDVPALMVTDTAFFRNHHYHEMTDTPDKLDYERMARVVAGLEPTLGDLLNSD